MSNPMLTNADPRVASYQPTTGQPSSTKVQTGETQSTNSGISGVAVLTTPTAENPLGGPSLSAFSTIFASSAFGPTRQVDMELVLAEVSAKLKDTRSDTELESVQANQELIRTAQSEKADKLAEATKKIEEAIAAEAKNAVAKFFSTLFKAIGAILAIALAAVAIATGAGALLGGLLIAAAAVALVSLTDDIVQQATGNTIAGNIAKAAGADEATIKKVEEVTGYVMLAVSIALTIATLGVGLKSALPKIAAKIADKAGNLAAQVTQESLKAALLNISKGAGKIASQVGDEAATVGGKAMSETTRHALTVTQNVGNAASGVNSVASGVTQGVQASISKDAQDAYAAASDKRGEAELYEAFVQGYQDLVDQALAMLMAAQNVSNAMLDASATSLRDRGDSMAQVRWGA